MLARTILIVVCIFSVLILVVYSEQSSDSTIDGSEKADTVEESEPYAVREQEHLKRELENYLEAGPREYEEQLSQAIVLFADKQFEDADKLLQSTRDQFPDQPDLLAHHAETIAMVNNGSFEGKPFDLLSRSLDLDSRHKPSLWMMALVNQQAGNHEAAVILFEMLKREMSPDSSSIEIIDTTMAVSVAEIEALSGSNIAQAKMSEAGNAVPRASSNPQIKLYVTLEPEILNSFSPDDIVYVYAQASDEQAMPLAVTRRRVSEFPVIVTLNDSMAMMPDQNLSSSTMVTVGARASRSGTAMAFAGDWEVRDL